MNKPASLSRLRTATKAPSECQACVLLDRQILVLRQQLSTILAKYRKQHAFLNQVTKQAQQLAILNVQLEGKVGQLSAEKLRLLEQCQSLMQKQQRQFLFEKKQLEVEWSEICKRTDMRTEGLAVQAQRLITISAALNEQRQAAQRSTMVSNQLLQENKLLKCKLKDHFSLGSAQIQKLNKTVVQHVAEDKGLFRLAKALEQKYDKEKKKRLRAQELLKEMSSELQKLRFAQGEAGELQCKVISLTHDLKQAAEENRELAHQLQQSLKALQKFRECEEDQRRQIVGKRKQLEKSLSQSSDLKLQLASLRKELMQSQRQLSSAKADAGFMLKEIESMLGKERNSQEQIQALKQQNKALASRVEQFRQCALGLGEDGRLLRACVV